MVLAQKLFLPDIYFSYMGNQNKSKFYIDIFLAYTSLTWGRVYRAFIEDRTKWLICMGSEIINDG